MFLHLPNVEEAEFFFPSNFIGRKTLDQMNKLGRYLVVSQMNNTDRSLSRLRKLTFGGFFFCLLPDFTRHLPSYAPNLENLQFDFRVPVPRPNAENLPIQVLIPSVNVPLVENLPPMQNLEPLQNLGGLVSGHFSVQKSGQAWSVSIELPFANTDTTKLCKQSEQCAFVRLQHHPWRPEKGP